MARCKLTRMSLRNIRKDKQYQCIVIDFVRTGVISKSKAEELLNYTIPAGLLENSAYVPDDDDDEGGESGGQGSGDSGNTPTPVATIPVTVKVGTGTDDSGFTLEDEEYLSRNDGGNLIVEVPVNKTWDEAVAMVADAVDACLTEKDSADSGWTWAGYKVEVKGAVETEKPFYAVPGSITIYSDGEPTEWYFNVPAAEISENGNNDTKINEFSAEKLASLGQGFDMLFVITNDSDQWYHNADWFAAL